MTVATWPFADSPWAAPPWTMRGDILTVWYEVNTSDLAPAVTADLLPETPTTLARARLYQLEADTTQGLVPFAEAVLAFRTQIGDVSGDVSYQMWTDSLTYLLWGREVYGWPLTYSKIAVGPSFWEIGGTADVSGDGLRFELADVGPAHELKPQTEPWITPRRRYLGTAERVEDRILLVRPRTIDPGSTRQCEATAAIDGRWPSAVLREALLTRDVVLEVGWAVDIVVRQ